jgi:hypothetical protein
LQARKKWNVPVAVLYFFVAAFLIYIIAQFFVYTAADSGIGQGKLERPNFPWDTWKVVLYTHIVIASVAFIIGPMQFLKSSHGKNVKLHRTLGKLYVSAIFISVPLSFYLAWHASGGFASTIAFSTLNVVWFTTTFLALRRVLQRNIAAHREWMVRSYATTWVFVTFRALAPLLFVCGLDINVVFSLGVFIALAGNLGFAEWHLRRTKRRAQHNNNRPTAA